MELSLLTMDCPELKSMDKSKAEQIKFVFQPMAELVENFEIAYDEVIKKADEEITEDVINEARLLRLGIVKVRTQTDKIRKEQKEEYLRAGKAIDGVSNIFKWAIVEKENKLKEIENHYIIKEQERIKALQLDRANKLSLYVEDSHERDLVKFEEDEFQAFFLMKKNEYEDKIKVEKKAEEEREAKEKAEIEYQKKIKRENERLKKEAEEREKKEKTEREKRRLEEIERLKKEEVERKRIADIRLKEKKEHEEKLRHERFKKEKIEAELEEKKEEEQRRKEEEERQIQNELSKDDLDKIEDLIQDLLHLKKKYIFKSIRFRKNIYGYVNILIDKAIDYINLNKDKK